MSFLLLSTVILGALLGVAVGVILLQRRDAAIARSWYERADAQSEARGRRLHALRWALSSCSPAFGLGLSIARLADAALLIAEDSEARANADARGLLEAVDWGLRQLQAKAIELDCIEPEVTFPNISTLSPERRARFEGAFSALRARHPFDEYDI